MKYLTLALVSVALSGCMAESNQQPISPATLTPIASIYKEQIRDDMRATLLDPASVKTARISDPFPMNDATGQPRWIVCVEYNARNSYGGYVGTERYAYKFAYARMWGPHDQGSPLYSGACDHAPAWHDWKI